MTIDFNKKPFIPKGWTVKSHKTGMGKREITLQSGTLFIDDSPVELFLSENQKGGKSIKSDALYKELSGKPVLNANVLDCLLAHTQLIPDSWKKDENGNTLYIPFLGTTYRYSDDSLYVRCLYWGGGRWDWGCGRWGWDCRWLDGGFGFQGPAAVLGKSSELKPQPSLDTDPLDFWFEAGHAGFSKEQADFLAKHCL